MARSACPAAGLRAALASLAMASLLLAAMPRAAGAQSVDDPLEPINRVVFEFNRIFDGTILKPVPVM